MAAPLISAAVLLACQRKWMDVEENYLLTIIITFLPSSQINEIFKIDVEVIQSDFPADKLNMNKETLA